MASYKWPTDTDLINLDKDRGPWTLLHKNQRKGGFFDKKTDKNLSRLFFFYIYINSTNRPPYNDVVIYHRHRYIVNKFRIHEVKFINAIYLYFYCNVFFPRKGVCKLIFYGYIF